MSSGFNTDVQIGSQVFHVQTEDRGPAHPVIDTVVYENGRVLHRRSSNYRHFAESDEFNHEGLRDRVEVEAFIDGAIEDRRYSEPTDSQGRARLRFSLPPLGKGDLTLVIRAATPSGNDELRFAMRSRTKKSSGHATKHKPAN